MSMKRKVKPQTSTLVDAETEAKEFENILRDVGQSIEKSCTRLGKSGLSFAQFKADFLKKVTKTSLPSHGSH